MEEPEERDSRSQQQLELLERYTNEDQDRSVTRGVIETNGRTDTVIEITGRIICLDGPCRFWTFKFFPEQIRSW